MESDTEGLVDESRVALQDWLRPYAAFCFLRDLFGTADHSQWGLFAEFTPEKVKFFSKC